MIDFTADKIVDDEEFDKTHTPPAPMMVRSEQKIVTLILSINKKHPEFMDIVIEGIQYKLFRLGNPQQVCKIVVHCSNKLCTTGFITNKFFIYYSRYKSWRGSFGYW